MPRFQLLVSDGLYHPVSSDSDTIQPIRTSLLTAIVPFLWVLNHGQHIFNCNMLSCLSGLSQSSASPSLPSRTSSTASCPSTAHRDSGSDTESFLSTELGYDSVFRKVRDTHCCICTLLKTNAGKLTVFIWWEREGGEGGGGGVQSPCRWENEQNELKWKQKFDGRKWWCLNSIHQILWFLQSEFSSLSLNKKKLRVCPCS